MDMDIQIYGEAMRWGSWEWSAAEYAGSPFEA